MELTRNQAITAAKALNNLINQGYTQTSFPICENGEFGVVNKRRRINFFVLFNGKKNSKLQIKGLAAPYTLDSLADAISLNLANLSYLPQHSTINETSVEQEIPVGDYHQSATSDEEMASALYTKYVQNEHHNADVPENNRIFLGGTPNHNKQSDEGLVEKEFVEEENTPSEDAPGQYSTDEYDENLPEDLGPSMEVNEVTKEDEIRIPNIEVPVPSDEDIDLGSEYEESEDGGSLTNDATPETKAHSMTVDEPDPKPQTVETEREEFDEMNKNFEKDVLAVIDSKNEVTEKVTGPSKLVKMLEKHGDEFTAELSKSFESLIKNDPDAAATIFMASTVATLQTYEGNIDKMSEELGIDDRDIAMAEYEFNARNAS